MIRKGCPLGSLRFWAKGSVILGLRWVRGESGIKKISEKLTLQTNNLRINYSRDRSSESFKITVLKESIIGLVTEALVS
jgi:hypothetical protein